MAIIGKIRKHSGVVVIVIGIALAGFILMQDTKFGNCSGGKRDNFIGKINGKTITSAEFETKIDEQTEIIKKQNQKENLTSAEAYKLKQDVWDKLEKDIIMQNEFEELGLAIEHENTEKASISSEELYDLMMGKFLHPYIIQNFTDPKTGQFNRQYVQYVVQNFDKLKEEEKIQWKNLENAIKEDRINTKYNVLIAKGYYVPSAFAKKMYEDGTKTANVRSIGVKYQTISDSTIKLTDADYEKYYEDHKYQFKQEESVDLDYVIFDVQPSASDRKKADEDIKAIHAEFVKTEIKDVENYVNANSDDRYDSTFFKKGALPLKIDSIMFSEKIGFTTNPYLDNNTYYISKLVQIQPRPDSIRANVILLTYKNAPAIGENSPRSEEQAKTTADSIYEIVKKDGKVFTEIAKAKSDFPTAKDDLGDLKWFADGDLNYKFYFDSCLYYKPGEIRLINSPMGYMLLQVTGKKELVKKVKVATIKVQTLPSKETDNDYLVKASEFAGASRTAADFNKTATLKGYSPRNATFVKPMDYTIQPLESAREILRWAYDEKTKKGDVSTQVFDLQGKYVVALLVEKREKGIAPLDQVKKYIEPLVKRDKKAEIIISKVNAAAGSTKDLNALATKLNTVVDTATNLTFQAYNYPKYGPEQELIGTIFTLKPNALSVAIKGNMAVYLVNVDGFTPAPAIQNINAVKAQLGSYFQQRIGNEVYTTLKDKAEIKDNRLIFGF
jgi:peptidyl-prolyl cis-trans isomerase D